MSNQLPIVDILKYGEDYQKTGILRYLYYTTFIDAMENLENSISQSILKESDPQYISVLNSIDIIEDVPVIYNHETYSYSSTNYNIDYYIDSIDNTII